MGLIDMSWSQYIIVEKMKCAFETRREISDDDAKSFIEYMNKLSDALEEADSEVFDVKVKDMTISEATKISNVAEKSTFFEYHCETGTLSTYFLLYFLKQRKIGFEIIHEEELEKNKESKYKDYVIIKR